MRINHKKFVVMRSKTGLGLFATTDIRKGDFIIEYTGDHITHDEADKRGGMYLFTVHKSVVIDGKGRSNTARYINHCCKPNAEAESDWEEEKIRIYAKKNILAGEEITFDYGKEHWESHIKPLGCRCRACILKK